MIDFSISNIKKVLVAENDADFFYLFNSALLSLSKSVDVLRTADGVTLLSLIESSVQTDIIFLDLNIPFKDGLSCLKAIRSNNKYNDTRVVMFSSFNSQQNIDNCYTNGADFFLIKPRSYLSLVQQFKNLFSNPNFVNNTRASREDFVVS
jgi:CheY-like chemotaxis protein